MPIGVRPSVPEPAPFQVGSYLGAPGSIGQYLADLFSSSPRSIIEQAELALRRIPEARRAAVVGALLTVPSQFRLPELVRIAGMNGEIPPDLPGQSTAPTDPGITVTLTSQGAVRQVAPPPAPQQVCLVNGYDPRWGPPPPLYLGVALRFDLPTASYIFDKAWAITNSPRTRQGLPAWSAADFRRIETSYVRDGLTLQPFRRSISSPWEFRWVVLTNPPQIHCETA